jgi:tetratricopeptide (TPR) repeat protein
VVRPRTSIRRRIGALVREARRELRLELRLAVASAVLAVVLAFVPLFNVLGYELATLYCVWVTFVGGWAAVRRCNDGTLVLLRDELGPLYLETLGRILVPVAPGPLLMLLNALRVQNCDIGAGLALFVLLPGVSAAVVAALVLLVSALVRGRWLRHLTYFGLITATIVASIAHLLLEPPIFAFHLTIGYFAGSIYDEALALPDGLLAFRLFSLALVAAVLAGLSVATRRLEARPLGPALAVLAVALSVATVIWSMRFDLRIESSRADIIEALGGRAESEHFVIYYPIGDERIAATIDEIVADHEYRWHQLSRFFGVEPEGRFSSFIYASSAQKGRMMGAARTLIAKPWTGEMHITWEGVGEGHMAHELGHLFSRDFGSGPLDLAGGLRLDMGLIEGAATAGAWDSEDLTYHGWSAAMVRLELAPDLGGVVGAAGFWSSYSRTVYTLMGSFCRWLVETRGAERFRAVYASGDFEGSYGVPLETLTAGWLAYLEAIPLSEGDLDIARFRFDRPSIFGKPCARSLAEQRERAYDLATGRRYEEAARCLEDVVADDPNNASTRLALAQIYRRAGELDAARESAQALRALAGAGAVVRRQSLELLGDIAWTRGDLAGAAVHYEALLAEAVDQDTARRGAVKLVAVRAPHLASPVFDLFLASPPPAQDALTLLLAEREAATDSGLLAYLLGMRMYNAGDFERARAHFGRFVERGTDGIELPEHAQGAMLRMARLRIGQCAYFLGELGVAEAAFEALAAVGDPVRDGWAARALDWAERSRWRAGWTPR